MICDENRASWYLLVRILERRRRARAKLCPCDHGLGIRLYVHRDRRWMRGGGRDLYHFPSDWVFVVPKGSPYHCSMPDLSRSVSLAPNFETDRPPADRLTDRALIASSVRNGAAESGRLALRCSCVPIAWGKTQPRRDAELTQLSEGSGRDGAKSKEWRTGKFSRYQAQGSTVVGGRCSGRRAVESVTRRDTSQRLNANTLAYRAPGGSADASYVGGGDCEMVRAATERCEPRRDAHTALGIISSSHGRREPAKSKGS